MTCVIAIPSENEIPDSAEKDGPDYDAPVSLKYLPIKL